MLVTENHETSTTLCGTLQIFASAVQIYADWIANYSRVSRFFDMLLWALSLCAFLGYTFSSACQTFLIIILQLIVHLV